MAAQKTETECADCKYEVIPPRFGTGVATTNAEKKARVDELKLGFKCSKCDGSDGTITKDPIPPGKGYCSVNSCYDIDQLRKAVRVNGKNPTTREPMFPAQVEARWNQGDRCTRKRKIDIRVKDDVQYTNQCTGERKYDPTAHHQDLDDYDYNQELEKAYDDYDDDDDDNQELEKAYDDYDYDYDDDDDDNQEAIQLSLAMQRGEADELLLATLREEVQAMLREEAQATLREMPRTGADDDDDLLLGQHEFVHHPSHGAPLTEARRGRSRQQATRREEAAAREMPRTAADDDDDWWSWIFST